MDDTKVNVVLGTETTHQAINFQTSRGEKKVKRILVVLSSVLLIIGLFTVMPYASTWLNFNGDNQVEE